MDDELQPQPEAPPATPEAAPAAPAVAPDETPEAKRQRRLQEIAGQWHSYVTAPDVIGAPSTKEAPNPITTLGKSGKPVATGGDAGAKLWAAHHAARFGNHLRKELPELG